MEKASTSENPGWQTWCPAESVSLEIPRWTGREEAAHAWNGELWEAAIPVGGAALIRTETRLLCAFHGPVTEARILVDPVGDLLSFYEFRMDAHGRGQSALWRKSRSGHLIDARWATGATYTPDGRGLVIGIPFTDLPPTEGARGETWRVALQSAGKPGNHRPVARDADFFSARPG